MSGGLIKYDFAQIHALTAGLVTDVNRLENQAASLARGVAALEGSFSGDAAQAYREATRRWQLSQSAARETLTRVGRAVGDGAQRMHDTDRRAAARFV